MYQYRGAVSCLAPGQRVQTALKQLRYHDAYMRFNALNKISKKRRTRFELFWRMHIPTSLNDYQDQVWRREGQQCAQRRNQESSLKKNASIAVHERVFRSNESQLPIQSVEGGERAEKVAARGNPLSALKNLDHPASLTSPLSLFPSSPQFILYTIYHHVCSRPQVQGR